MRLAFQASEWVEKVSKNIVLLIVTWVLGKKRKRKHDGDGRFIAKLFCFFVGLFSLYLH